MKPLNILLMAVCSTLVFTPAVSAQSDRNRSDSDQRRGESDRCESRVILYSQANFPGERFVLEAGEKIDDFNFQRFSRGRSANNRVTSISIEGDVDVTLFDYRSFKGDQITITRSVRDLGYLPMSNGDEDWNNELSSVVVRERSRRAGS
ncbi:MAG: hypothetical protein J6386_09875 [Candidatus Synoicihabitans palmerolidicus]|nr:hypothetical protein [Candidatus Synoicihabitans palmerolidicus]